MNDSSKSETDTSHFEAGSGASSVIDFLNQAVRDAGGRVEVARRSGIPLPTLNGYLGGRQPKAEALLAIARACNISLDKLITGKEPRARTAISPADGVPPAPLDKARLQVAVTGAYSMLQQLNQTEDHTKMADLTVILYEHLVSKETNNA